MTPFQVTMTVEDYNAMLDLLNAQSELEPSLTDCKVWFSCQYEGPKGLVNVRVQARGLYKAGSKSFYARSEKWTHVKIESEDCHFKGQGVRSWYDGTQETVYSRFWQELVDLAQ